MNQQDNEILEAYEAGIQDGKQSDYEDPSNDEDLF